MNFELDEDTKSILETTRRFVKREVLPRIKEGGFKRDIVKKLGEMGLFGCAFPLPPCGIRCRLSGSFGCL